MPNDAVFNFDIVDKASAKLMRIKQTADKTQVSVRQAADRTSAGLGGSLPQLFKMGGGLQEGGIFGRLAEKGAGLGRVFASAGAAGGIFAGVVLAAGVGLNAYAAASERAVENTKAQVEWQQKLTAALEDAKKARAGVAAGGVGQAGGIRQLLALGGGIGQVKSTAASGVEYSDAMAGEIALMKMDPRQREWIRRAGIMMARTGASSYEKSVGALSKTKGSLEKAMLAEMGLRPTAANRAMVSSMLENTSVLGKNQAGILNIDAAVSRGGLVAGAQATDLLGGKTASAIQQQNRATLDPLSVAMEELEKSTENVYQQMVAASKAQYGFMRLVKEMGYMIGMSEGSERIKLTNFLRNRTINTDEQ